MLPLTALVGCTSPAPAADGGSDTPPTEPAQTTDAPAAPGPYDFVDDLGKKVHVDNPQRVVSVMPSFAEMWQLSGGSELVGVTDDALTEAGSLKLSEDVALIGLYNAPNLESILALTPDFVLLSAATPEHVALQEALTNAGIQAAYFKVTHFEDYLRVMQVMTDITARPDLYKQHGTDVQDKIQSIIAKVPVQSGEKPKALVLITFSRGSRVQSSETMPGQMLKQLGCDNLADENPSLLQDFSIEAVIEQDPDYIFVIPMGNSPEAATANLDAAIEGNPAWKDVSAVKNGNYVLLDQDYFLYKPNNRWDQSYQILYDAIYG
jgi:iron complex transport system substrate-binding protein